jgi:hypothetical protein
MSNGQFDPSSNDATFAKILANQENHAAMLREMRDETRAGFEQLHGRVSGLETFRANLKGKIAIFSTLAGGASAAVWEWFKSSLGNGGNGHS